MDKIEEFKAEVLGNIDSMAKDSEFVGLSKDWTRESARRKYTYNFSWLGRPIIQYPQDIYAFQELIWKVKPDLVIETGIAHGGSLIMSASMLAMIDHCEAIEAGKTLDPAKSRRKVLGIDIDIREHNRKAIMEHPMSRMIEMVQGSSIADEVVAKARSEAGKFGKVLVSLDSNHTHDHVLAELEAYAPLTSKGSYCVVWDTLVEEMPVGFYDDRPWDKGDNPKTAVFEYLRRLKSEGRTAMDGSPLNLEIDKVIDNKLQITAAPDGFLFRP